MERVWRWARDQEWTVVVSVAAAVVVEIPAFVEIVRGEWDKAGARFSWAIIPVILSGVVIRSGVWARRTVQEVEIAARAAHGTGRPVLPDDPALHGGGPTPMRRLPPGIQEQYPVALPPDE